RPIERWHRPLVKPDRNQFVFRDHGRLVGSDFGGCGSHPASQDQRRWFDDRLHGENRPVHVDDRSRRASVGTRPLDEALSLRAVLRGDADNRGNKKGTSLDAVLHASLVPICAWLAGQSRSSPVNGGWWRAVRSPKQK